MGWGGARPGAGRKKKPRGAKVLAGTWRQDRDGVKPELSREELQAPTASEAAFTPPDDLTDAERAHWVVYLPRAMDAGTLSDTTLPGFVMLCRIAAQTDSVWGQIEREGLTVVDELGTARAHPLWPTYRNLVMRHESMLQRFLLTGMARPHTGTKPDEDDADMQALRSLLAIK